MNVLFVTTFNDKIWEASTKNMLKTYLSTKNNSDFLLVYENFVAQPRVPIHPGVKFIWHDMTKNEFLNSWMKENADVIHPSFGGKAVIEKKPQAFLPWNLRAAGWFRKIVCLDYTVTEYRDKYDAIVFIDSDCEFQSRISSDLILRAFGDKNFFYHWGRERKKKEVGVETSIVGFKTNPDGMMVLNFWIDKFRNKYFRKYLRWDDGGVFGYVVDELVEQEIHGNDLVETYEENGKSQTHVVERGMFKKYVVHNKGLHKRLGLTNEKKV